MLGSVHVASEEVRGLTITSSRQQKRRSSLLVNLSFAAADVRRYAAQKGDADERIS